LPAGVEVIPSIHTDLRAGGKVTILALVVEDYKPVNIRFSRGQCKQKKTKKCKKTPTACRQALCRRRYPGHLPRGISRSPLVVRGWQTRSSMNDPAVGAIN